ncbi:MAG: epoxyqueuosine reductase QueH [Candidatus Omnitrophica bacterium]|nr:epoxyqueuosine reductase QueH [Candidatus Omnitrophota bacterium]
MKQHKEKILLHVCCATCSSYVIKVMAREFIPTIYYYNPNIHPFEEYLKRRLDIEGYVRSLGLDFIEGDYEPDRWQFFAEGLKHEPEGGARCEICFRMRLNHVVLYAVQHDFQWFATTLTVSPHKKSGIINRIGKELAEDYDLNFYQSDFKKHDGFKISVKMAKELDFYRQDYCGCIPSYEQSRERKRTREEITRQTQQIVSPTNV